MNYFVAASGRSSQPPKNKLASGIDQMSSTDDETEPREFVDPGDDFREDLLTLEPERFIRKRLIFGGCFVYPHEYQYYNLIEKVADRFEVHPTNIFVVGSAKLGFSIAPMKRYAAFRDKSDIDLVIVSDVLFDRVWTEFHSAKFRDRAWRRRNDFLHYLFQGWLRPDYFPDVHGTLVDGWWKFFRRLSKDQPARVSGAIYRTWAFFEAYQRRCVTQCADAERGRKDL